MSTNVMKFSLNKSPAIISAAFFTFTISLVVSTTRLIVNVKNAAEMIVDDLFNENFITVVDITFSEIEDS